MSTIYGSVSNNIPFSSTPIRRRNQILRSTRDFLTRFPVANRENNNHQNATGAAPMDIIDLTGENEDVV